MSIEACTKLILDTDSDVGRHEAFHYEDMEDIAVIMKRLFHVDMTTLILSNVYVREKKG